MRTTRRNGVSAVLIGPLAIPFSFLYTLGGLLFVGWLGFCTMLDIAFDGNGFGATLFFLPLLGIGALVGLTLLVILLVKQFRMVNRSPHERR